MAFTLMPKEMKFFDLFDQQASNAVEASVLFKELAQSGKFDDDGVRRMRELEHEGDTTTHEVIDTLNRTFVTPFDREDIHALACELDDVVDLIHSIATRMRLYRLSEPDPDLIQFAEVIEQSARAVAKAVNGLREIKRPRRILDYCIEINRLENVGDQLREAAIGKLFDGTPDPIAVIKRKEIYEVAETTLDKCEDVANIVESILVKQG
ncbi:MAG: DUF47 domain-containing protein [Elusimicrobia bacterium]|nr:DUF47 domain-containing protein [Elusimicrobiota bacterium]